MKLDTGYSAGLVYSSRPSVDSPALLWDPPPWPGLGLVLGALISQPLMSADFWLGLAHEKCGKNRGKEEARIFQHQLSLPGVSSLT